MTDREHIQTLLTVAKRYWLEQATQAEIAAENHHVYRAAPVTTSSCVGTGPDAHLWVSVRARSHVG